MPSLAGALAAKVREKRRKRGGETIDDLHATWPAADDATVRALVSKGTKTSVRKLRKLGLLSVGEDAEQTAESLRKLAERIDRFHAGGEEGEARARDGDGEEEAEGMEGAMVDAGKAYERLVVSLAARSGDEALRGGVVETYGRDGERGLMMEQASSSSEEEDDNDNDNDDDDDDDDDDEEESAEGGEAGGENDEDQAAASTERRDEARSNGKSTAFRVASKLRKALQKREFFGEHVDLSVDDLEGDAVLAARRREMRPAEGEGMQAWEKSRTVMMTSDQSACPAGVSDVLSDYGVKARVATRWKAVHEAVTEQGFGEFVSQKQAVMFGVMSSYMDVLYPLHRYPSEVGAKDPVMDAALLHIINHIAVSGDVIKKNNELADNQDKRKKKKKKKRRDGDGERDNDDSDDEIVRPQDQGFVRPKVLILAPFRHHAKAIVERLIQLAIQETRTDTVKNKKRFEEEFGVAEEYDVVSERERVALSLKPKQHRALFDGNCDDHFRLGIKITRGSIRLFTDFYDSDVLVASPLGLSTRLEEVKKDEPDPKDFLSSIEISVLYRADALLMQNMAHVLKVYESLNAIPKQQHNSDILRVRDWYLGARAGAYRQNILLSSFESPEINSLFTRYCLNHAGIARWKVAHRGVLGNVSPGMKHVFERLETQAQAQAQGQTQTQSASKDEADVRFEHFTSQVWPKIREASCGQLLFVPSYFDLVRVRNFLRKEAASFVVLSEYTTAQDMARARNYFCDGRRRVLLYTERCHFYNRHRIRGIKDIYFYQLPEHQQFYAELANFVDDDAATATVNVVYTRRDAMRLERTVGTSPAKKMLAKRVRVGRKGAAAAAAAATFVFVPGE